MGPHLGKLVNIHTLNLARTRCDVLRQWLLLVFLTCCGMCALCGAGNDIGAEGAVAMGPHLGKLVNIHTLNLARTRYAVRLFTIRACDCSRVCSLHHGQRVTLGPPVGEAYFKDWRTSPVSTRYQDSRMGSFAPRSLILPACYVTCSGRLICCSALIPQVPSYSFVAK